MNEGLVRHTISQGQVSPNQSQVSSPQWRHFNTTVTGLVKQRNCRKPFFTESEPFLQFYTFYLDINSDAPAHDQKISPGWFTFLFLYTILYWICFFKSFKACSKPHHWDMGRIWAVFSVVSTRFRRRNGTRSITRRRSTKRFSESPEWSPGGQVWWSGGIMGWSSSSSSSWSWEWWNFHVRFSWIGTGDGAHSSDPSAHGDTHVDAASQGAGGSGGCLTTGTVCYCCGLWENP